MRSFFYRTAFNPFSLFLSIPRLLHLSPDEPGGRSPSPFPISPLRPPSFFSVPFVAFEQGSPSTDRAHPFFFNSFDAWPQPKFLTRSPQLIRTHRSPFCWVRRWFSPPAGLSCQSYAKVVGGPRYRGFFSSILLPSAIDFSLPPFVVVGCLEFPVR